MGLPLQNEPGARGVRSTHGSMNLELNFRILTHVELLVSRRGILGPRGVSKRDADSET